MARKKKEESLEELSNQLVDSLVKNALLLVEKNDNSPSEIIECTEEKTPSSDFVRTYNSEMDVPDEYYQAPLTINSTDKKITINTYNLQSNFSNYDLIDMSLSEHLFKQFINEKENESLNEIESLTDYYYQNFKEFPESYASSGKPIKISPFSNYEKKEIKYENKSIKYYIKQYNRFKINSRIKKNISNFHFNTLFSQVDFTHSRKKKLSMFTKIKWNINKICFHLIKKFNLFPTDKPDMIHSMQLGVAGKLTNEKGFTSWDDPVE